MSEETKPHGLFERLTSALASFRGEDDLTRYNTLNLEPVEEKAGGGAGQVHHYGYDGGYSRSFERFFHSTLGRYMGSSVDYEREVGDPMQSSLVMAAVNWLGLTLPEAPIEIVEPGGDGKFNAVPGHELAVLLEKPNPHYPGELLWTAFAASDIVDGNVYWWKVRNAMGKVIQLWPLPHYLVEPRWPVGDDTVFISHYAYQVNGVEYAIPPEDIVHFRRGVDPLNPRKGLSPLASLYREIYGDNEASNASALLMKNSGVFPFIVSPKGDATQLDVEPQKLKEELVRRITGDERGKPVVQTVGVEVQKLSFSPRELDMSQLRRVPEERVAAVLGIPAIVLGFGAGLERSTFANYKEAREAAYESHVIPKQRGIAGHINLHLLPDFDKTKRLRARHDLTQVRVLQDDRNKLFQRLTVGFNGGWMKRGEARAAAGLKAGPDDDVYKSQTTSQNNDSKTPDANQESSTQAA